MTKQLNKIEWCRIEPLKNRIKRIIVTERNNIQWMHTIYNNQGLSYKWSSGGSQGDKLHEGQGDCRDWIHSDQMVLTAARQGRLDSESGGEKWLKGLLGSSPVRSDGSHDGQAGRLDQVTGGQRHSKLSQVQWELPGSSPFRSDGSHGSQTVGWIRWPFAKGTQMKVGKRL